MTLTFPTWASFCIWLPGYSRASESKSEFCPTFFISPSESELNSMRCGTGVHTHHESLSPAPPDQFPACRSGHPRYASDVAHTPAPQRSDTGHRSRRDDLRPDRLPRPALSRRHRGCRMRLHPIEPVQPRDFPVLRAAAQHLALPAMPHAQPARAQVQQRTLQTLLPALRPPQPVAHVAVFFGRSLTISRKAVWHLLHPARRTCVWGGYTPERECPATPRSRVLECVAPRPGKSWP